MQKKWNISILVLFVLLASSLLGLLTMTFVQSMMQQTMTLTSYYQSYYLAKAGLEFSLAQLPSRGIGFEYVVGTWSDLVASNFFCATRWCDIVFSLSGTSRLLSQNFRESTWCEHPFSLSAGGSLLVPLFQDITSGWAMLGFASGVTYQNLYSEDFYQQVWVQVVGSTSKTSPVVWGMLILSWEELYAQGIYFHTWDLADLPMFFTQFNDHIKQFADKSFSTTTNKNFPYKFYLMVSVQTGSSPLQFCLNAPAPLPTQQYYIKSIGKTSDQMIGLEAVYHQPIPDFLLNTSLSSVQ